MFRKDITFVLIIILFLINILPCISGIPANTRDVLEVLKKRNQEKQLFFSDSPTDNQWNKTFGGKEHDYGRSVQQTNDGGYILSGYTYSYGAGSCDVWLIKTNSDGEELWNKTYGGTDGDGGHSVQQTADDGYVVIGGTGSYGAGDCDVWLIKTDSDGNEEWNKTYGGTSGDIGQSVQQTSDDGYIITGSTRSFGPDHLIWVLKTDSSGNEQWNTTFGTTEDNIGYSVDQTDDGGYIITGEIYPIAHDVLLLKLDANGSEQWNKTFAGLDWDNACSVQQTNDGGFIIAGATNTLDSIMDFWLIKTDSNGNEEWNRTHGGDKGERGYSVQQTNDDGYIITGVTETYGTGTYDGWLVKTDEYGNKEWDKTFGGTDYDVGHSVQQTEDNGFIITGWTEPESNNYDVLLVKVAAFENQRPNWPVIKGQTNGKAGRKYEYKIMATDPDDDNVYYFIDWDSFDYWGYYDTELIGPFASGEEVTVNHTWYDDDNFTIKVMTIDVHGGESDWATMKVTMPKYKALNIGLSLLDCLFERLLNIFPLLRYIKVL